MRARITEDTLIELAKIAGGVLMGVVGVWRAQVALSQLKEARTEAREAKEEAESVRRQTERNEKRSVVTQARVERLEAEGPVGVTASAVSPEVDDEVDALEGLDAQEPGEQAANTRPEGTK